MNERNSIKWKLVIFVAIVLSALSVMNITISCMISRNELVASERAKLSELADKSAQSLDSLLKENIKNIESVARRSEFLNYDIYSPEVSNMLSNEAKFLEGLNGFSIVGLDGKTRGGMDLSNYPEFISAKNGVSAYSNPLNLDGERVITISVPIRDADGKVMAVLSSVQALELFSNSVVAGEGERFIINSEGTYIAHSSEELLNKESEIPEYEANKTVRDSMMKGENGFGKWILESDGEDHYIGYSKVETTGWSIGILEDEGVLTSKIYKSLLFNVIPTMFILIIALGVMYVYLNKAIVNNIKNMINSLTTIAGGDFKTEIDEKMLKLDDEIGMAARAMDDMKKSIGEMILNLKNTVNDLSESSGMLNTVSEGSKESSRAILSVTEEIATAIQSETEDLVNISENTIEFGKKLDVVANNIDQINKKSFEINDEAESGNNNAKVLGKSVEEVNQSFNDFTTKIDVLNTNIAKITEITSLINDIAEQTNLLALNASIEAARAGEAGKGFAVVAEEIRKLAEECKSSAEGISNIISKVSNDAESIIDGTKFLDSELNKQVTIIDNTVESYGNIVKLISEISNEITGVTSSIHEINRDKDDIIVKVENATAVSEEITASTEEVVASSKEMFVSSEKVSDASEELAIVSENISEEVKKFII